LVEADTDSTALYGIAGRLPYRPGVIDWLDSKHNSIFGRSILRDKTKDTEVYRGFVKVQTEAVQQETKLITAVTEREQAKDKYGRVEKESTLEEAKLDTSLLEEEVKQEEKRQKLENLRRYGLPKEPSEAEKARHKNQETRFQEIMEMLSLGDFNYVNALRALDAMLEEMGNEIMASPRPRATESASG
jgi:hypothetical protein